MRTETIEKTFYTFDELSNDAKEKARDWWRDCERADTSYHEFVVEDFAEICALLGVDIRQRPVKTMGGETRYKPVVYWSGFWSQGDGACFEGSYSYKPGSVKAIKAHAPLDTTLHDIAARLRDAQRKHFYKLSATMKHEGRYCHEYSMSVCVEHNYNSWLDIGDSEEDVKECMRDLARWLYRALEKEYEFIMSDENVDENIRANEYEFDEFGGLA